MWQIKIHRLVIDDDLKQISKNDLSTILKTLYRKLSVDPEKYGAPLRSELKGFWKLKISHYRVIYKIEKSTVKVLALKSGMRRDEKVYRKMLQRINKI